MGSSARRPTTVQLDVKERSASSHSPRRPRVAPVAGSRAAAFYRPGGEFEAMRATLLLMLACCFILFLRSKPFPPEFSSLTFPGRSTVVTPGGVRKTMDELQVGDRVLSGFKSSGAPVFAEVYGFAQRAPAEAVTVLDVVLAVPGRGLSISQAPPGRYVFECAGPRAACRGNGTGSWRARPARELARGSLIRFHNHGIPSVAVVRDTWASQETGVYAPLISGGSVYVDGVLVDGMLAAARDPHSTAALRAEAFARWALDATVARAVLHALGPEAAQTWAAGGSLLAVAGKRCTLLLAAAASLAIALALMARSHNAPAPPGAALATRPSPFSSVRTGARSSDGFAGGVLGAPLLDPPGLVTPRCSTNVASRDFGLV